MTIKLNSYSLPEDTIIKMRQKIEETRQKQVELGFGLCRMKNINTLRPGLDCTGNECSIEQWPECRTGVYVGGFHTHPDEVAEPSIADLRNAYINDVECVGSPKENAIRCFVRKGIRKSDEEKNITSIDNEFKSISGNLTQEQYINWKNARDEIWSKHFDTVIVK